MQRAVGVGRRAVRETSSADVAPFVPVCPWGREWQGLKDEVSDALSAMHGPEARASALTSLAQEIYKTLEWVQAFDSDHVEVASAAELLTWAFDHQARMARADLRGSA